MTWWALFAFGWCAFAAWAALAAGILRFLHDGRLADRAGCVPEPEDWPKVSVVVPALDEAQKIEEALRSIARMDYPSLEVIAVDDRSRDETGAIMDRVAAEEPRVEAVHVGVLPKGWLGKCHALHVGAQRATGDLLLFTDGDVVFAPDTLRLAVRHFIGRRLDHLALMPGLVPGGYWEDAVKGYFAMLFISAVKAWVAGSASKNVYVGIGAFNLVSRSAYERIGGHEKIRLEVAEDLMLGKNIKQAGYRQDALIAPDHVRLRWQEGVRGFVLGLEKNGFAGIGYSLSLLFLVTLLVLSCYAVPYLGVLAFRDSRIFGYAAAVLLMHGIFGYFLSFFRKGGGLVALALPVAAFIYLFSIWRSTAITLRRRGILWRGTFYPLDVLKRGSSE